jgi:hypothetical protein
MCTAWKNINKLSILHKSTKHYCLNFIVKILANISSNLFDNTDINNKNKEYSLNHLTETHKIPFRHSLYFLHQTDLSRFHTYNYFNFFGLHNKWCKGRATCLAYSRIHGCEIWPTLSSLPSYVCSPKLMNGFQYQKLPGKLHLVHIALTKPLICMKLKSNLIPFLKNRSYKN